MCFICQSTSLVSQDRQRNDMCSKTGNNYELAVFGIGNSKICLGLVDISRVSSPLLIVMFMSNSTEYDPNLELIRIMEPFYLLALMHIKIQETYDQLICHFSLR